VALLLGCQSLQNAVADGDTRTITMHHVHSRENITATFKRNGRYDDAELKRLNWFLRDWRHNTETRMDPRLIDLVWEVYREVGATQPIQIIGGYRDEGTNAMLRRRSSGVAQHSLHMSGKAMDFMIPGVPLERLRVAGLRLQRGGVGFYPSSGSPFVHMDVGGVRHWPRMTRDQLARVFPDGRTVHVPSDGKPLAGYAQALAAVSRRGGTPSSMSLTAARNAGIDTEMTTASVAPSARSLFAGLFGRNSGDEPVETKPTAAPPAVAAPATRVAAATAPTSVDPVPLPKMRPASAPIVVAMAVAPRRPHAELARRTMPSEVSAQPKTTVAVVPGSPNDIIRSRGYWAGQPELLQAKLPTNDQRLAYAAEPPAQMANRTPRRTVVVQPSDKATSLAASAGAPLTSPRPMNDPWLNAVAITPSVWSYLSATQYGARDFRSLQPLLDKPAATIVMSFSADPYHGLNARQFDGAAIVFVRTTTFAAHTGPSPSRTAALY
jgi:uncharacterized protein YcbK (DUF882 family)